MVGRFVPLSCHHEHTMPDTDLGTVGNMAAPTLRVHTRQSWTDGAGKHNSQTM